VITPHIEINRKTNKFYFFLFSIYIGRRKRKLTGFLFVKVKTVSYMRLEKGACKSKLPPHTTTKQQLKAAECILFY